MLANWRIFGDAEDGTVDFGRDGISGHLWGEGIRVQMEGPAADGGMPDECETVCPDCGWAGDVAECDSGEDGEHRCPECGAETRAPDPSPETWCNSLGFSVDPEENAVHVRVSLGDPRGAFVLTVRRLADGRLIMHVPHPGESFAHLPLAPVHAGTYAIGREPTAADPVQLTVEPAAALAIAAAGKRDPALKTVAAEIRAEMARRGDR